MARSGSAAPSAQGQAIKLVNQYLVAVHTMAASEAAAFAVRLGADLGHRPGRHRHVLRKLGDAAAQPAALHRSRLQPGDPGEPDRQGPVDHPFGGGGCRCAAARGRARRAVLPRGEGAWMGRRGHVRAREVLGSSGGIRPRTPSRPAECPVSPPTCRCSGRTSSPFSGSRPPRRSGSARVEMLFPHQLDADRLVSTLDRLDLEMVVFDPDAGDWASGERGLLALPGREEEFVDTVRAAIDLAARIGTSRLNALVGRAAGGCDRRPGARDRDREPQSGCAAGSGGGHHAARSRPSTTSTSPGTGRARLPPRPVSCRPSAIRTCACSSTSTTRRWPARTPSNVFGPTSR